MTEPFFLRLIDEPGTTAFTLSDCGTVVKGVNYFVRMPERDISSQELAVGHGGDVTRIRYRNVVETCEIVMANTVDVILDIVNNLDTLFDVAHQRQHRGQGDRVYIEHRPEGRGDTNDTVRSELLSASYQFLDEPLSPSFNAKWITLIITWTRRYYWESLDLVEVGIANRSTSHIETLGGVTIRNHYDSGTDDDNWVKVSLGNGLLPAPARWEITNDEASGDLGILYIGRNQHSTPGSQGPINGFDHILEGEDGNGISGTPAVGVASNDEYAILNWSGTTETEIIVWDLSSALLGQTNSNWFLPIIRFHTSPPANTQMRVKIKLDNIVDLETRWTEVNNLVNLQELVEPVKLPPRRMEEPISGLELALWVKNTGAGSHTINLDFLQLTPMDSFRILKNTGADISLNDVVVDDQIDYAEPFVQQSGTNATYNMLAFGGPTVIYPFTTQTFYFLQRDATGGGDITRELTLQLKHRPRSILPYIKTVP